MKKINVPYFIASVFIFLFTYTACVKLFSFASFRTTLSHSPLIGHFSPLIAVLLPLVGLIIAAMLFFPRSKRMGLWVSFTLIMVFSIYLAGPIVSGPLFPAAVADHSKPELARAFAIKPFFDAAGSNRSAPSSEDAPTKTKILIAIAGAAENL